MKPHRHNADGPVCTDPNCPLNRLVQRPEYAALFARREGKPAPQRTGLGDLVAQGLAAVGVTKELAERVLGGPCGCQERQEALNALGEQVLGALGLAPKAGPGNSSPGSH